MTGTTTTLLQELADDARAYLAQVERLETLTPGGEAHTALSGRLYAAIVELRVHAAHLQDHLDAETELEDIREQHT